eukprot:UC1_evm3s279
MANIQALLASPGIDVNCTDTRHTTPLHWAAVCNRPDVCTALVNSGAKLQFRDMQGMTALHYAMKKGFRECGMVLQELAQTAVARKRQHRQRTASTTGGGGGVGGGGRARTATLTRGGTIQYAPPSPGGRP